MSIRISRYRSSISERGTAVDGAGDELPTPAKRVKSRLSKKHGGDDQDYAQLEFVYNMIRSYPNSSSRSIVLIREHTLA